MILAQAQHIIIHETRITSGSPGHIYGAAVLAGLIAIGGWIAVHWFSKRRDIENWRRTMITEAVSDFIELSKENYNLIGPYIKGNLKDPNLVKATNELVFKMGSAYQKLQLCATGRKVQEQASLIIKAHHASKYAIMQINETKPGLIDQMEYRSRALFSGFDIITAHHELIREVQKEFKQEQSQPIDLNIDNFINDEAEESKTGKK